MFQRFHCRAGHYLLLLIAACSLFLINLGGPSLWDLDEGRNSTCSLEMLESGNWIVPTFNAELRVDKPALLYWLQIAAYRLFGVSEFSARLPSTLAALLTLLLCYELGRRMFNPETALLAGLIVGSAGMFCAAARFANPDALLNLLTTLTLLLFWLGYPKRGRLWYVAVGTAAGFAVLAKGPVGVVLPLAVIGLFLLWNRNLSMLFNRRFGLAVLSCALVALPWYIWVAVETKADFLRGFLLTHNVGRFLNPMENHGGSALYYPLVLLVGFAPWSVFLGLAGWYGLWSMVRRPVKIGVALWDGAAETSEELQGQESTARPTITEAYRFLGCWIGVYLVFFSLAATKLPNYILPIYGPVAVLTARALDRWRRGEVRPAGWTLQISLVFFALVGVAVGLGLAAAGGVWEAPFLRGRPIPGLAKWAALGLVPVVGAAAGWWYGRHNRAHLLVCLTLAAILFIGPLAAWASVSLNRGKPSRPLVEWAGAFHRDQDIRIGCWGLEHLPSLNFYCQRDVAHFGQEHEALAFLRYPIPVYLFLAADRWDGIEPKVCGPYRVVSRHRDMYRGSEVVVVTNSID
jgi:4-amino-4-deoxy-L-arabinose transferase-like glycosyltransferase